MDGAQSRCRRANPTHLVWRAHRGLGLKRGRSPWRWLLDGAGSSLLRPGPSLSTSSCCLQPLLKVRSGRRHRRPYDSPKRVYHKRFDDNRDGERSVDTRMVWCVASQKSGGHASSRVSIGGRAREFVSREVGQIVGAPLLRHWKQPGKANQARFNR